LEKDSLRVERQDRKLSESVGPSFCDLVERFMNPKIAHRSEQNGAFFKNVNSYDNLLSQKPLKARLKSYMEKL
jgi:hypothetical protein